MHICSVFLFNILLLDFNCDFLYLSSCGGMGNTIKYDTGSKCCNCPEEADNIQGEWQLRLGKDTSLQWADTNSI